MDHHKKCKKCQEEKPYSEFYKRKDIKSGLDTICKVCNSKKGKAWRTAKSEHCKEYSKNQYQNRKEEVSNYYKEKYKQDKTPFNERSRQYRESERGKQLRRESDRLYRLNFPEKANAAKYKRRARELNQLSPFLNQRAVERIYRVCAILNKISRDRYQVDHILPLSKGGIHHEGNLQIIKETINKQKGGSLSFRHPESRHFTDLPLDVLNLHPREIIKSAFREVNLLSPEEEIFLPHAVDTTLYPFLF